MDYSVKNFIKQHCTKEYIIDDLNILAVKISNDSAGKYTVNSALNTLCKYAYVKNNNILFNPENRNFNQSLDAIKANLTLISKNNVSKPIKKGGFGTFTSLKEEINNDKNIDDKIEIENVSKSIKKSGFGTFKSLMNEINNDSDSVSAITKKNELSTSYKSRSIDCDKKTQTKKTQNLFNSPGTINKASDIFGSVEKKPTRGGFGNFNKSLCNVSDSEKLDDDCKKSTKLSENKKNSSKIKTTENTPTYEYPKDLNINVVVRNDSKYGPYGTDNYHASTKSDTLGEIEKERAKKFRILASKYYPAQKSDEWFELRDKMTTASDGGTVLGLNPYECDFGFISKKVHGKPFDTSIACYHGKKYEQAATIIYEYRMNVMVKEFGLCQHPEHLFLGASPDGIVSEYKLMTSDGRTWASIEKEAEERNIKDPIEKYNFMSEYGKLTKYVGRMLEIKCPMMRKILMDPDAQEVYGTHGEPITNLKYDVKKGVCPTYYWVQVQLQLQCCDLDECDFWQCEISEYANKEDFLADTDAIHPWLSKQTKREKGVVIQLLPREHFNNKTMDYDKLIHNFSEFIHQPKICMTPLEIDLWILETIQNLGETHKNKDGFSNKDLLFERILYWKLDNSRNITIQRDDKWFLDNLETFRQTWNYVEYFRANKNKSLLLKKYLDMQPVDYYGKITEKIKGSIMNTIRTIYAEPDGNASKIIMTKYEKFITSLLKDIEKAGIEEPVPYNVNNDINYIKESLDLNIKKSLIVKNNMNEHEQKKYEKEFIDFIKFLKFDVDNYHAHA